MKTKEEQKPKGEDDTPKGGASSSNLAASIKGAGQLVLLQIMSRMSTFILNQIALRFITREVLGIVAVEMELLSSTILFLSRENIRMALLRSASDTKESKDPGNDSDDKNDHQRSEEREEEGYQKAVNMTWIAILVGALLSLGFIAYFNLASKSETGYSTVIAVFCLAAFVELLSEPMYVITVNRMKFDLRLRVEGSAVVLKCVAILGLLVLASRISAGSIPEFHATMAFALAQLAYSLALLAGYTMFYVVKERNSIALFFPKRIQDGSNKSFYLDPTLSSVALSFTLQGLLKHVLTEGDKILSVYMITAAIQGDYALVEKYGSLIARMIFQPLEETGRVYFSRAVGSTKDFRSNIETASLLLSIIIRLHIVLGFIFIFIGTNYTGLAVDILAGRVFSSGSAPIVLAIYCIYVPIMGVNGITEAYLQALATKETLTKQSYWMGACWAIFIGVAYVSIKIFDLGAMGLVVANCVNLLMRIGFAWSFIRHNLLVTAVDQCKQVEDEESAKRLRHKLKNDLSIWNLVPSKPLMWIGFLAIWVATFYSDQKLGWQTTRQKLSHLAIGVASGVFALLLIYTQERRLVNDVRSLAQKFRQR
ncbi:Oligosaccharide translocation protein rft1 [Phlyctochytrium planicorne]|nr:Oligosaccharide translocation protein rft1 [Phlyctochytrium planicorne]